MDIYFLIMSIVKIAGVLAWVYGLLRVMNHESKWVKLAGIIFLFGIVQVAILVKVGDDAILNSFDTGLLFQACTLTMVALGLNLIFGFNGQFSLGQYGFYGIGAYAAADITYRWANGQASGLIVAGIGVILIGGVILGLNRYLARFRGLPVLSAFTLYLIGVIVAGAVSYFIRQ